MHRVTSPRPEVDFEIFATPNSPQKLPVIVLIHGGKFVFGSGASVASAPDFIMNEDVIFVTINYRLGVLGFFSTGDDEAPGNFGLKDQVAALRWVQHNIAQFGGDPKKVTLMGQSAGSKSVHLHMFSSLSKGLFQRAISQSGSAFSLNIQPLMDHTSQARQQAQIVGCPTNNSAQLVRCLRGVDARTLVSAELNLWQPVLEKRSSSNPEPFLTASPLELVQSGDFYKVPWLMGSTSQEGAFIGAQKIVSQAQRQAFSEHMDEDGPDIFALGLSLNQSDIPETWKRIRDFYFGEGNNTVSKDALSKLYTDRMVVHSVHKAAVLHSQAGQRPIFKYNFGYRGKYSYVDFQLYKMTPADLGEYYSPTTNTPDKKNERTDGQTDKRVLCVVHTDDLIYLVPLPTMRWWPEGHPDLETLHVMVAMWTNFAKYGNPTPNCANIGLVWQPFNTSTHAYLNISQDIIQVPGAHGIRPIRLSMETFLYKDRMQLCSILGFRKRWLLLAACVSVFFAGYAQCICFRRTSLGFVSGLKQRSQEGKPFCSYRGIPYAVPPVGELRFKAPQPFGRWPHLLQAKQDAPICPQRFNGKVVGDEDCLYLNVYAPKHSYFARIHHAKYPVMLYIHGGLFEFGTGASNRAGPEYLLNHDVVLVTINYRLGVLGFLSTGDDEAPGNWAMKDQVAALRWVRDNIHNFGGDPNKITLMGHSAGATSVHFHMFSPLSRGMFHRAISQSGTAFSPFMLPLFDPFAKAQEQAWTVGCPKGSSVEMVRCLRKLDVAYLVENQLRLWQPVVEAKRASNPDPFLTSSALEVAQSGDFYKVPWLMGSTSQEGALYGERNIIDPTRRTRFTEKFDTEGPGDLALSLSLDTSQIPETWRQIRDFYFGERSVINIDAMIKMYTDRYIDHSVHKAAVIHTQAGHHPIYRYNFAYQGRYSYAHLSELRKPDTNLVYKPIPYDAVTCPIATESAEYTVTEETQEECPLSSPANDSDSDYYQPGEDIHLMNNVTLIQDHAISYGNWHHRKVKLNCSVRLKEFNFLAQRIHNFGTDTKNL
ncbi:hypothetical protein ANN_10859 [Periplaneta americana]|uniref:Carboxylesterase type B domain-containing protein n=1 Tax=Periplaneta americana TaxID=6978 RepID=A0ABQ8T3F0_PERAM|nr:hypothetical protein ANN_10859 [Periplaneta americana]